MKEITNAHDRFFREVFSKKDMARGFFRNFLPHDLLKHLNLDSLSIEKGNFVDKKLKEAFSDLLYSVKTDRGEAFIYLLVEHKSFQDRMTAFQLLRYIVRILEQYVKQHKDAKNLPLVVPVVLYHGRNRWQVPNSLRALFDLPDEALARFIPDFEFPVRDLGRVPDENLRVASAIGAALLAMKYIWQDHGLISALDMIGNIYQKSGKMYGGAEMFETLLRYVIEAAKVDAANEEVFEEAITEAINIAGGDFMGTLAEKWFNQGMEKGVKRGHEGLLAGIRLAMELKFGKTGLDMMPVVEKIQDIQILESITDLIRSSNDINEFRTGLAEIEIK